MTATTSDTALAVVTGPSTGIDYELARCRARKGFDLLVAADGRRIETVAEELCGAIGSRSVGALLMPAGAAAEQHWKMAAPRTAER